MGPNGSGKSTLAHVLAGRPGYEVTAGAVTLQGPGPAGDEPRGARPRGRVPRLPVPGRDPGVSNVYFLKAALNAIRKHRGQPELDAMDFLALVKEKAKVVDIDDDAREAAGERGLLGRREEAQRDLPDGDPRSRARHPRRDRLRPRHRRPARRGRGRQPAALARSAPMVVVTHYQRLLELHRPRLRPRPRRRPHRASGGKELALELEARATSGSRPGGGR